MGDEPGAFAEHRDLRPADERPFSPGGRIDDYGTYRFVCPVPDCRWFHDEKTTQDNPGWRQLVEAAIAAHLAADHDPRTATEG
ncbi:hypothetical protein [Nocardia sp. NPDC006630]|uniref:hypothetical protein n=1 Tax=Nocardia sp. NPDC006630 TaxID=3157181 RepID=UPI0033AFEE9B